MKAVPINQLIPFYLLLLFFLLPVTSSTRKPFLLCLTVAAIKPKNTRTQAPKETTIPIIIRNGAVHNNGLLRKINILIKPLKNPLFIFTDDSSGSTVINSTGGMRYTMPKARISMKIRLTIYIIREAPGEIRCCGLSGS